MRSKEFVKGEIKENASAGATGASAVATVPATGGQAGTLFGGTFQQRNNPFRKKGKKK